MGMSADCKSASQTCHVNKMIEEKFQIKNYLQQQSIDQPFDMKSSDNCQTSTTTTKPWATTGNKLIEEGTTKSEWPPTFPPYHTTHNNIGSSIPITEDQISPSTSTSGGSETPVLCAGCQLRIVDKFLLNTNGRKWHAGCIKCAECGVELDSDDVSCFEKNGHIFCKQDYLRIYGNRHPCSRCNVEIHPSDLVMKARHCVYHIDCFRCAKCEVLLKKGEFFSMFNNLLFCQMHVEEIPPNVHTPQTDPVLFNQQHHPQPPFPTPPSYHGSPFCPPHGLHPNDQWCPPGMEYTMIGQDTDYNFDNNNEPVLKKRRGRKKRKVEDFSGVNGFLDGTFPPGGMMDLNSAHGKTKRARTSFKHNQLRIMKAHFQMNQNPDSRELKMLSQKTGLDKKVLQVWFQNSRAKFRRVNAQGSGGEAGSEGGLSSTQHQQEMAASLDCLDDENVDSDSFTS